MYKCFFKRTAVHRDVSLHSKYHRIMCRRYFKTAILNVNGCSLKANKIMQNVSYHSGWIVGLWEGVGRGVLFIFNLWLGPYSRGVTLKYRLTAFDGFNNKQTNKMFEVMFFLMCKSIYILKLYSVHYTLSYSTNVKKIPFGQDKWYKICPLFSFTSSNSLVLLLICDSCMSWRATFVSLKPCVGFAIFHSASLLLKFIFLFNKMHGLFDYKTS